MSYCRWSNDNFQCDLYCYKDTGGGYTTCVARYKIVRPLATELPAWPAKDAPEEEVKTWATRFACAHAKQLMELDTVGRKVIGLPYDGETFNDPDLRSFLARLQHLYDTGYNVPQDVITTVLQEIAEDEEGSARTGSEDTEGR